MIKPDECKEQCHVDLMIRDPEGESVTEMALPYAYRGEGSGQWADAQFRAKLPIILQEGAQVSMRFHNRRRTACEFFMKRGRYVAMAQLADDLLEQAQSMLKLDNYRRFDDAESSFLALRHENPKDPVVTGWLAQLYVAWAEQLQSEIDLLGEKNEASHTASRPDDQEAIKALIERKTERRDHALESATALAKQLMIHNPDNYIGFRVMADYHRVSGAREQMDALLEKVAELNPDSNGLLFVRGAAKAQFDKDYDGAIELYDQAIANDPMFIKALYFKGLALHAKGEEQSAREVFSNVLSKSPDHPGSLSFAAVKMYLSTLTTEARRQQP
jgi:tetratricopeptide (TPR) repeat protein